jgi:hypothetical protein
MWFAEGAKLHQRGYTLVAPDPQASPRGGPKMRGQATPSR